MSEKRTKLALLWNLRCKPRQLRTLIVQQFFLTGALGWKTCCW